MQKLCKKICDKDAKTMHNKQKNVENICLNMQKYAHYAKNMHKMQKKPKTPKKTPKMAKITLCKKIS